MRAICWDTSRVWRRLDTALWTSTLLKKSTPLGRTYQACVFRLDSLAVCKYLIWYMCNVDGKQCMTFELGVKQDKLKQKIHLPISCNDVMKPGCCRSTSCSTETQSNACPAVATSASCSATSASWSVSSPPACLCRLAWVTACIWIYCLSAYTQLCRVLKR